MKSRDFCYWLQGYFEIDNTGEDLDSHKVEIIQRHLNMVFEHEIDPSFPDIKKLRKIHNTNDIDPSTKFAC